MSFSIRGYVLEKPRVGSSNSPFTLTPDNVIVNQAAFDAAFPNTEINPRAEYMVLVTADGDLPDAEFGWTKNDLIQRFDWDGRDQRYKNLPGGPLTQVGTLAADSNSNRLKVPAPKAPTGSYPIRLSIGNVGIGIEISVSVVPTDANFGLPIAGVAEISEATGNINWSAADLATYEGQPVRFQRQAFFTPKESTGAIGKIPAVGTPTVLMNPIPGAGQFPLIRFGFGLWLHAIEVPTISGGILPGTFQWDPNGLLAFNAQDINNHRGETIYYDGVLLGRYVRSPAAFNGTVAVPATMSNVPPPGGDVIFRAISFPTGGSCNIAPRNVLTTTGANLSLVQVGDVVRILSGDFLFMRRRIVAIGVNTLTVQPPFPGEGSFTFDIEHKDNQFGQTIRYETLVGNPGPSSGQVALDDTGAIATSAPDQAAFGPRTLASYSGDIPIENGISLRLFRTPVDPEATSPDLKDVSAFYPITNSILMDPLVGTPFVTLPIRPIDEPAFPLTVRITQGTGTFPEGSIPRLDTPSPPAASAGYGVDFEGRQLNLVSRKNNQVISLSTPTGAVNLPDPLVDPDNIVLELDQGLGYAPLVQGKDVLLDAASGVLRLVDTSGSLLLSGTATSITSNTLTDAAKNFAGEGVLVGDYVVIPSGPAEGIYEITVVGGVTVNFTPSAPVAGTTPYEIRRGKEVLADRFFKELLLTDPSTRIERVRDISTFGTNNIIRQSIPVSAIGSSRIRIAFAATNLQYRDLLVVPTSSSFSLPANVPAGKVEVAADTGELNFRDVSINDTDVGFNWKWALRLTEGKDFRIEPLGGFIQTIERLLSNDELCLTYRTLQEDGTPGPVVTNERATFLVRKEIGTYAPPSSATFNKFGKTVAAVPPPSVFRGGRPQDSNQVAIDIITATVTFLPDKIITNALPHGSNLGANERVYVDYFIYEAIGGENTTTALQAPMYLASIYSKNPDGSKTKGVVEGYGVFYVPGNRTADFPANSLLRVGNDEVYQLAAPTYSVGDDETTVPLIAPQTFRNSAPQPRLYLSSGPTPITPSPGNPAYFVLETGLDRTQGASGVPRGMNIIKLPGDRTSVYQKGTVVFLSAPADVFNPLASHDMYLVEGSQFKAETNTTEITTRMPMARQYNPLPDLTAAVMRRSVRPVLDASATAVQTLRAPVLEQGFTIFRKVAGQGAQILAHVAPGTKPPKSDLFSIDEAGGVTFKDPLVVGEEFSIFYTGYTLKTGNLRVSYTSAIVPTEVNGLLNQGLVGDFTAYAPDTFYYRVETITNYRGEVAKKYKDEAKSSVPSGGPTTSNSSQSKLQEQGVASVFFEEGALYNEDVIARAILKYYNDIINYLEDVLQGLDGRVVGDADGRFKFDGTLGTVGGTNNQIDDKIQISPFPVKITMPGFGFTFVGTFQKAYVASPTSRFYPTSKVRFGTTTGGDDTSADDDDPILDFGVKNLTGVSTIFRRAPRALLTQAASGTSVTVDNAGATDTAPDGKTKVLRPAFVTGMKVHIPGHSGVVEILGIAGNVITLDGSVTAPKGSTLTMHPSDSESDGGYQKAYRTGFDIEVDLERGQLLFVNAFPPFDGSVPLIPMELRIQEPDSKEMLEATVTFNNTLTEPEKFPALFGLPLTDDGDQAVPYINPSPVQEQNQLSSELALVQSSGPILSNTTDEFLGTGSLDVTQTIITSTTAFNVPLPQVWDLVYIVDGLNGGLALRRISAVAGNTVTVDEPYPAVDSGFTFWIARGNNVGTGTSTGATTTSITEALATFPGVKAGHSIIFTSGVNTGVHRQVTGVVGDAISFTPALSGLGAGVSFRVSDALATFISTDLATAVGNQTSAVSNSIAALDQFFNTVSTDIVPSTAGTVSGTTLTAGSGNFLTSGVSSGHFVYIQNGVNNGVYPIVQINTALVLDVDPTTPFPFAGAVTFRVVSAFGVTKKSLSDVSSVKQPVVAYQSSLAAFAALVTTPAAVATPSLPSGDTAYGVRILTAADYAAREAAINARIAAITAPSGPIATLEKVLSAGDRLYDKRYTWIDARINLEKGLLVKQTFAVANRLKAQADTVKQLIKLVAVQE